MQNWQFVQSIGMLWMLYLAFLTGKFYAKTSFVAARWAINVMQTLLVLHSNMAKSSWLLMFLLNSAALFLVRYFCILKWHFWNLSIDMGIFWGSWFLHIHEIPHPNQWESMKSHKKMMFIQWRSQSSRFYLYIGSERSAFPFSPILLVRWQNVG